MPKVAGGHGNRVGISGAEATLQRRRTRPTYRPAVPQTDKAGRYRTRARRSSQWSSIRPARRHPAFVTTDVGPCEGLRQRDPSHRLVTRARPVRSALVHHGYPGVVRGCPVLAADPGFGDRLDLPPFGRERRTIHLDPILYGLVPRYRPSLPTVLSPCFATLNSAPRAQPGYGFSSDTRAARYPCRARAPRAHRQKTGPAHHPRVRRRHGASTASLSSSR